MNCTSNMQLKHSIQNYLNAEFILPMWHSLTQFPLTAGQMIFTKISQLSKYHCTVIYRFWYCEWNDWLNTISSNPSKAPVYPYYFAYEGGLNLNHNYFVKYLGKRRGLVNTSKCKVRRFPRHWSSIGTCGKKFSFHWWYICSYYWYALVNMPLVFPSLSFINTGMILITTSYH